MKSRRITLHRGTHSDQLRTDEYPHDGTPGVPSFGLCNTDLSKYFSIPRRQEEMDIVLSTREHHNSYAVKQSGNEHIEGRDPADHLWVDDEFAQWIGNYATAAGQEWVFVSFEYPKGVR
jgi:hypothetical protein